MYPAFDGGGNGGSKGANAIVHSVYIYPCGLNDERIWHMVFRQWCRVPRFFFFFFFKFRSLITEANTYILYKNKQMVSNRNKRII